MVRIGHLWKYYQNHIVLMPGERWSYEFTERAVMLFMEPEIEAV